MTVALPCQGNLQQIAEHGEPGAVRIIVEAPGKDARRGTTEQT